MAKKKGKHNALEARRRKNRRRQNAERAARLAQEGMLPDGGEQTAVLTAVAEPDSTVTPPAAEAGTPESAGAHQESRRRFSLRRKEPKARAPWRYHTWVWYLMVFLLPLAILTATQLITVQSVEEAMAWASENMVALGLGYLLLLACEGVLLAITGGIFSAGLILAVPMLTMSISSYFKEVVNGVPLMVSDLAMATHMGTIAGFMKPGMSFGACTIPAVLLVFVLLALTLLFARRPRRIRWYASLIVGLCGVLVLVGSANLPLTRDFLSGPEDEIQAERNDRLGFLLGMYSGVLDSAVQEPDAYNENNMNGILLKVKRNAASTQTPEVQPNVIMIMSESFCDPEAVLPGVEFEDDPIPNYRALAEEWPSGKFLSNTYAGGTGNVEMEVMMGIPIAFVGEGEDLTSLQDETAYDRAPSIIKAFSAQGYATEFVHSYTARLYNREENFEKIGFDKLVFEEDFPEDAEWEGPYLSDMALTEMLISEFENRDKGKPLLLYGLSMENHQPYYEGKFEESSGLDFSSDKLGDQELGSIDALLHGIHDADAALGELLEYFEQCEEPVIVIFWGDHLPGLSMDEENTIYSELGYSSTADTKSWSPEELKRMHTTRFLVWNNYGAELEVPETVSATSLGVHILDWAGVPRPLYFQWVDMALEDMLLYRQRLYVSADGTPYYEPPEEDADTVDTYRTIVYDILYGQGYIADAVTAPVQKK